LSNYGRQETKELAEVQEIVQLCIKPIEVLCVEKNPEMKARRYEQTNFPVKSKHLLYYNQLQAYTLLLY